MPELVNAQANTATNPTAPAAPAQSAQTPPAQAAAPSQPAAPAQPSLFDNQADPSAAAAASANQASSAQQLPAAPQVPTWLSQLRERGMDFGQDETEAMNRLADFHRNYQQVAPLAPYVQQYMQYAPQFAKYLAEQKRSEQQAQQPHDPNAPFYAKYWQPPEYNPAWERLIRRDEQGNLAPAQGAPPDIVPKYLAYQQFRQEQAEAFLNNPHEYIAETVKTLSRQEAERLIAERFDQQSTQQTVQSFMHANEAWLYDKDQSGGTLMTSQFDPTTGKYKQVPKLSQWGQAFTDYVKQEADYQARMGIPQDVARQRDVAMAQVQRDFAIWKMNNPDNGVATGTPTAQAPQMSPQQAANQRFLAQNNPAAAMPPASGNSTPAPQSPPNRRNLHDMLRERFKQNGITDEVLNNAN